MFTQTLEAASIYPSPVGKLLLIRKDDVLTGVFFEDEMGSLPQVESEYENQPILMSDDEPLNELMQQLDEYFAGRRQAFQLTRLTIQPNGTAFQLRVWKELCRIPYGQTISYGELAGRIGQPNASRAVGLANGRNPVSILIPCHRVIGSNGKLVGYGGGLDRKQKLFDIEASTKHKAQ